MKLSVVTVLCLASTSVACSEAEPPDAEPPAYGCLEPAHVFIFNEDEIRSRCFDAEGLECGRPGLAFPKGRETRMKIRIFDDDGRLCDPAQTTVGFVDSDAFSSYDDGYDFVVVAARDAFDEASLLEPSAVMVVSHGALSARWQAMAVVDLVGTWEIAVDDLTVGDFEVAQSGRFIRWAQCDPDDTRPECSAGVIYAGHAKLQSPIGSLTLEGAIAPSRDSIDGTWTSGETLTGYWYAVKLADE